MATVSTKPAACCAPTAWCTWPNRWLRVSFALCRAVDDETCALPPSTPCAHPRLRLAQTFDYLHLVVLADFAAFRERLVSANHGAKRALPRIRPSSAPCLPALGQPVDDGRQFIQPMRVHLLHPLPAWLSAAQRRGRQKCRLIATPTAHKQLPAAPDWG